MKTNKTEKPTHTSGPWLVGKKNPSGVYSHSGLVICAADSMDELSREEEVANARLISAAPEMLKALWVMARLYSDSHVHEDQGRDVCAMCDVEAAIAKAEGR